MTNDMLLSRVSPFRSKVAPRWLLWVNEDQGKWEHERYYLLESDVNDYKCCYTHRKSTISRLLFRFYDPDSGIIYIDGHDVKTASLRSIRQQIGVVPQDIVLFNESVYYNIAYGNWQASEDAVFRAAKFAQIHNTILKYPDGKYLNLSLSGNECAHQ